MTFFASFLDIFVECILEPTFHGFWSQLGAHVVSILGPCWALLPMLSSGPVEIGPSAPYPMIYNTKWPSGHPKSGPKSIKNRSKRAAKSIRKVIEKHVEFGIDFLTIFCPFWLPTWGGAGGPTTQVFGVKLAPGAQMAPRAHPSSIFGRFLIDFWSIFGRFWGRC